MRDNPLLEKLFGSDGPVSRELIREFVESGPELVPDLVRIVQDKEILYAPSPRGWAAVNAVRILGELDDSRAVEPLVAILDMAHGDLTMGDQVVASLEKLGEPAIEPLIVHYDATENQWSREMTIEILTKIALEFQTPKIEKIYELIARLFRSSIHPSDSIIFAGYLSDIGRPEAIKVIEEFMRNNRINCDQYEAFQEAIERLGGECPVYYFDEDGRGYPLDEDRVPMCPVCSQKMGFLESGDLVHRDNPHLIHQEEES